jgi:superfamily II DNA or RNA helicase
MTKKVAHIWVRDEVYMTVSGVEPEDHQFLWNKFGIPVDGYFYMPAYKLGRWDGKIRFYEKTGKVFLRFLPDILPFFEKWGYDVELHDERRPVNLIEGRLHEKWFDGRSQVPISIRPYQIAAVNAALDAGSGFVIAATGAGKTIMVAGMCDVFGAEGYRTITIVPSSDLVEQTSQTFKLCGIQHGLYSGAKKDLYQPHVIATWQALQNNPSIMEDFQVAIVDEAHGAKAATIGDLLTNHGKHIAYRFGFTGTWPKPVTDQYTLRGSIGDILYEINAADLIRMGYLANLEIQPIEVQETVEEDFPDYSSEKAYTSKSKERLEFLADLIISKAAEHGNTLVLVNSIKQGQQLQKLINDSIFLCGADETEVRAEWYSTFEKRDDLIVLATAGIASTGISIDRIFHLCLIDSGKSFVRAIQSIGRGLRKGHDKEFVYVSDVHSGLKWGKKHARERIKFYKEASYTVLKTVKAKL